MRKIYILLPFTLTGLIVHVLYLSSFSNPAMVELYYSRGIYPLLSNLSVLTASLPFSAAEVLFYAIIIFVPLYLSYSVLALIRPPGKPPPNLKTYGSQAKKPPPFKFFRIFLPLVFLSGSKSFTLEPDAVLPVSAAVSTAASLAAPAPSHVFKHTIMSRLQTFIFRIVLLAVIGSTMYAAFDLGWSFNYARVPLADSLGLDASPASVSELNDLCGKLALQANTLRSQTQENENGVFIMNKTKEQINLQVKNVFRENAPPFMNLGSDTNVKGVFSNNLFSKMNIHGMYIPFTLEPNVNMQMPDLYFSSSALHEYAHFKGFAREDEANFIAFYISKGITDTDFSYSATILALVHSINQLNAYDSSLCSGVYDLLSNAVKRDLANQNVYWEQFKESRKAMETMNQNYLESNQQKDGIQSYGRMVDLLIALNRSGSL